MTDRLVAGIELDRVLRPPLVEAARRGRGDPAQAVGGDRRRLADHAEQAAHRRATHGREASETVMAEVEPVQTHAVRMAVPPTSSGHMDEAARFGTVFAQP